MNREFKLMDSRHEYSGFRSKLWVIRQFLSGVKEFVIADRRMRKELEEKGLEQWLKDNCKYE